LPYKNESVTAEEREREREREKNRTDKGRGKPEIVREFSDISAMTAVGYMTMTSSAVTVKAGI
jgi:hypothetical protein